MAKIKNRKTGKVYEVTEKKATDILTSKFGRNFKKLEDPAKKIEPKEKKEVEKKEPKEVKNTLDIKKIEK